MVGGRGSVRGRAAAASYGSADVDPLLRRPRRARASPGSSTSPMTRTSHALAADGHVWLVDPVAGTSPRSSALPRSARRPPCSSFSIGTTATALRSRAELGVPHLVVPDALPGTPFEVVLRSRARGAGSEIALWWPGRADARRRGGDRDEPVLHRRRGPAGVHLLLRLSPPRAALGRVRAGAPARRARRRPPRRRRRAEALAHRARRVPRTGLVHLLPRIPAFAVDAYPPAPLSPQPRSQAVSAGPAAGAARVVGAPRRAPAG